MSFFFLQSVILSSVSSWHADAEPHMGSLGPTVSVSVAKANGRGQQPEPGRKEGSCGFRMPLHYPRYKKADYEAMPEWRLDRLLREYGLPADGDLDSKRRFAMGAFLWPGQY